MTAKKQKEKERRRARKMADEAWDAVEAGNLDLARKLSQRAVTTQPDNPRLWADRGRILLLSADETGADRAFRYAIRLARDFAEPYHHLAALRARQDRLDDAVALEADALRLAPDNPEYAAQLEAYRSTSTAEHGAWGKGLASAAAPAVVPGAAMRRRASRRALRAARSRDPGAERPTAKVIADALVFATSCGRVSARSTSPLRAYRSPSRRRLPRSGRRRRG
jgi:tetratricopeptide (TPR) repeat protein